MTASSLLLFGPQSSRFTQAYLSELRTLILGNPDLNVFVDAITELPSLWPNLQEACPHLSSIQGVEQLNQLTEFLTHGAFQDFRALKTNVVLTPLTLISQAVEFLRLSQKAEFGTFPAFLQEQPTTSGVQGFCVGFLAAAAVACSQNKKELVQYLSIALRLAVCIGSIIDLDEERLVDPLARSSSFAIQWKTENGQEFLERTLKCFPHVSFRFSLYA